MKKINKTLVFCAFCLAIGHSGITNANDNGAWKKLNNGN